MNTWGWITKDLLDLYYKELGSFKLISEKYNIPCTTIKYYSKKFGVKTIPKLRYLCNDYLFGTDTEESFYVAGFIAADGCIGQHKSKKPNNITICLSQKDEIFLLKLKNILCFTGPITSYTRELSIYNKNWNNSKLVRFTIYSKQMIKDLKRFKIGPRKSLIYRFPKWLIKHPLVNHFMRGYNDGDGCFYYSKEKYITKKYGIKYFNKLRFSLRGTLPFLNIYKRILIKNGINSNAMPVENNGIGQLSMSGVNNTKLISLFLYKNANIFLERKYLIIKHLL